MNEIVLPHIPRPHGPRTTAIVEQFLAYNAGTVCQRTTDIYRQELGTFTRWAKARKLSDITNITTDHVVAWINYEVGVRHLRGGNVLHKLKTLKRLFEWAKEEDIIQANPVRMQHLPRLRKQMPDKIPITLEQYQRLLIEVDKPRQHQYGVIWPYLKPIMQICWHTGLRTVDVCFLKWSSVRFDDECLELHPRKLWAYRQRLEIPMEPELHEILLTLWNNREHPNNPYVLPIAHTVYTSPARHNIPDAFATLRRRAGLRGISLHGFRHGFVTRLINADINPITVCAMTGQSLDQLKQYTHVSLEAKGVALDVARAAMHQVKLRVLSIAPEPYAPETQAVEPYNFSSE